MLEWIISSSVLILIILGIRLVFRGKISMRLQYALWAVVMIRLLIPGSVMQSNISVMNAVEYTQDTETDGTVEDFFDFGNLPSLGDSNHGVENETTGTIGTGNTETNNGLEGSGNTGIVENNGTTNGGQTNTGTGNVNNGPSIGQNNTGNVTGTVQNEKQDAPITAELVWQRFLEIVPALWIGGMLALGTCFLASNIFFAGRLKNSRQLLREKQAKELPIYSTGAIDTPCLSGVFKPAVYITKEVLDDKEMMEHVLAHEETHYRHKDHIWSVLRCLCLVVHWYNPLVWIAAMTSKQDAELACDEATVARLGEDKRVAYGRTVVGLTYMKPKPEALLLTATAMSGSKTSIKERVTMIAKKPKTAIYILVAVLAIAIVAVGCTFTGANIRNNSNAGLTQEPEQDENKEPEEDENKNPEEDNKEPAQGENQDVELEPFAQSLKNAIEGYTDRIGRQWVEDVHSIIADEESDEISEADKDLAIRRRAGIRLVRQAIGADFISQYSRYEIRDLYYLDDTTLIAEVYIWTMVEYQYPGYEETDEMGMGVVHYLKFRTSEDECILEDTAFDESLICDVSYGDYNYYINELSDTEKHRIEIEGLFVIDEPQNSQGQENNSGNVAQELPEWCPYNTLEMTYGIAMWLESYFDDASEFFESYNGDTLQRIAGLDDSNGPATRGDVVYYHTQTTDIQQIINTMAEAMIAPLMEPGMFRPYTITAYKFKEHTVHQVSDNMWLIDCINGYYKYEGTDIVDMESYVAAEGSLMDEEGYMPFLRQGSGGVFIYVLFKEGDTYRLQRLDDMISLFNSFYSEIRGNNDPYFDEKESGLEFYNHGTLVSYNPETNEAVFEIFKWVLVSPEDDPTEQYPNGYRLDELGEQTLIISEELETWIFVENSSYLEYGKINLSDLPWMVQTGYQGGYSPLFCIYMKDGKVQMLLHQYQP